MAVVIRAVVREAPLGGETGMEAAEVVMMAEEGQTLADCSTDHTSKTRQILGKCCSESTARALRVRAEGLGYMSGAERGYMTFTRGKRITRILS